MAAPSPNGHPSNDSSNNGHASTPSDEGERAEQTSGGPNAEGPAPRYPSDAAVLQSMTLLATLSTAADVGRGISERRAGRDPSAQEPTDVAAPHLHAAANELQDLLMQLFLGRVHVAHAEESYLTVAVRHFDILIKMNRIERLLQVMHQRLLSIYPDVSEELVEEARIVHSDCNTLRDASLRNFVRNLDPFLDQALGLVTWTQHEVA